MAFRRPSTPPGPITDFFEALHELHLSAGEPSADDIARGLGFSRNTVHLLFIRGQVPKWGPLELVVEKLCTAAGEDPARYRELWKEARKAELGIQAAGSAANIAQTAAKVALRARTEVVPRDASAGSDDAEIHEPTLDELQPPPLLFDHSATAPPSLEDLFEEAGRRQAVAERWYDLASRQHDLIKRLEELATEQRALARMGYLADDDELAEQEHSVEDEFSALVAKVQTLMGKTLDRARAEVVGARRALRSQPGSSAAVSDQTR